MTMKRRSEFASLGEVGRIASGRAAAHASLARLRVFNAWRRAVGEGLHVATEAVSFERGTLHVVIRDARWLPELRRLESEILGRMKGDPGGGEVRRLDFHS